MTERRARHEGVAAATNYGGRFVFGVNAGFHGFERGAPLWKKARSVAAQTHGCKVNSTLTSRYLPNVEFGRRLSTKLVDNCVDDSVPSMLNKLHECDNVKLIKF
jgi:hypothetical protein